jgi:hypothetical protein
MHFPHEKRRTSELICPSSSCWSALTKEEKINHVLILHDIRENEFSKSKKNKGRKSTKKSIEAPVARKKRKILQGFDPEIQAMLEKALENGKD